MQEEVTQNTVGWALAHGVAFRTSPSTTRHTPFALTPTPITRERFHHLKTKAGLLGKLVHVASEDDEFLKQAMEPITDGDFFFHQLWSMHQHLSKPENQLQRLPLLIMRTDFMDDAQLGPKVIEFNGIAAGMAPFGQRIHELHSYVQTQWPDSYTKYSAGNNNNNKLVENRALEGLADGIARATRQIKQEFNDRGPPRFLMIVQPNEDNVFDQHLLEFALQARGIQTVRRSFQELYGTLKTGDNHRLLLDGVGSIDTVYLRAGYLHCDYYSKELDGDTFAADKCCQSLMKTRCFIERHRVAMNATVNQQLASSKRVQTLLSAMTAHQLTDFGLTLEEAEAVKDLLGENWPVNAESLQWMQQQEKDDKHHDWVLKNQGEGGGHAIMGDDILPKLQQLSATPKEYPAWSLMRRLRPLPRPKPTLLIRDGMATECSNLISEIGIFSVHINGVPATTDNEKEEHHNGYVGYLIRRWGPQWAGSFGFFGVSRLTRLGRMAMVAGKGRTRRSIR